MELRGAPPNGGTKVCRLNAQTKKTHHVGTANQNFVFTSFFSASLLSTQWRKPSSGSLSADGDTVGGWLELPSTVGEGWRGGGEGAGGWPSIRASEAAPTDRCLMADDTKYAVIWPESQMPSSDCPPPHPNPPPPKPSIIWAAVFSIS